VVIGGSDAGVSAALRAREVDPSSSVTMLVADEFPNYSICGLPFYLSGEVPDWHQLAHRSLTEIESRGIDVRLNTRATRIDPEAQVVLADAPGTLGQRIPYDRLVLATGALPVQPPIIGQEAPGVFLLHSMADSFRVRAFLDEQQPRQATIVGAGYIGLEMADALTHRGIAVTLVEQAPAVLPTVDPAFGRRLGAHVAHFGVDVRTGVHVQAIERTASGLCVVGEPGLNQLTDMVLIVVGVRPHAQLAQAMGIPAGVKGAIPVDREMRTGQVNVWAAGDCVETAHRLWPTPTYLPLGTTAHKQGRVAGENAAGGQAHFAGSLGTQVVKVFDWAIGRTGLTEREAVEAGYQPRTTEFTAPDHKAYYPGAQPLMMRVTGDHASGRLLGAQIMGHWQAQVAKRLDLFAMALYQDMRIAELLSVDLSYTPPLGSPWDAVQMAADDWLRQAQPAPT